MGPRFARAWLAAPAVALAALAVPKCPLCLLAWLALLGVGRPSSLAVPLASGAGLVLVAGLWGRSRKRSACCQRAPR